MILYSASWDDMKDPFGLFDKVIHCEKPDDLKTDGVLILWGGEDIGTEIYGEKPNRFVYSHHKSQRDNREIALVNHAIENSIPIIGICRGAQLICALAGGSLAQHIDGHGRSHAVTLHDEGDYKSYCNSSHHQMMLPPDSAKVLATAGYTTGLDQFNMVVEHQRTNEVVWFPTINALGIQPHPEWDNCPQEFLDYCIRKIQEYVL